MGNGNSEIGTSPDIAGQPILEGFTKHEGSAEFLGSPQPRGGEPNSVAAKRPTIRVAMAQQCGDSGRGNDSAPQKFVQLVGCRDLKARYAPSSRPPQTPGKP